MKRPKQTALSELIRIAGSQRRLAEILETTEESVSRWVNGSRGVPDYVPLLVELLNTLPRDKWPERWK